MNVEIKMPQISMTMLDGVIVKWHKHEGDIVSEGENLVEIQTDKIIDFLHSAASGKILKILSKQGDIVPVGAPICILEVAGKQEVSEKRAEDHQVSLKKPVENLLQRPLKLSAATAGRASPLAKKIAQMRGIDLSGIKGTGPGGLIVKADLPEDVVSPTPLKDIFPSGFALDSGDEVVPFDRVRRSIADNMMLSKRSAAEVTTVADVEMSRIKDVRKILPISYTSFVIAAAVKALQEYPVMNALVEEDRIVVKKKININVAVATKSGLLTPVISDAGNKNVMTIAEDLLDLADRGRAGQLKLNDFENGTFTVTNSGVFGSVFFTPILNYPQSAVLGIGRIAMTPVVREGEIVAAPMMYLSLTYNHRSVDGETAVTFLQRIRYFLENPDTLLGGRR